MADEQADVEYMKQLMSREEQGERITIVIGPFSAMMMIGLLQFATRHPDMEKKLRDISRDFIRQLEPLFVDTPGEDIIRRGGHPEFDR